MEKSRTYSDLDLAFSAHPFNGDVSKKYDENAINRSLRNLIMMEKFDKKFKPELNAGVKQYLFEPMTPLLARTIKSHIQNVIEQYEPRVELINITVNSNIEQQSYEVIIEYRALNNLNPVKTTIYLQRVR